MNFQHRPPLPDRLRRILDEVASRIERGQATDPASYYARHPDLEDELRGHFRRLGLLDDPFRDAGQFRRVLPPWEAGMPPVVPASELPASSPSITAPAPLQSEREALLRKLPGRVHPGPRSSALWRRLGAGLFVGVAFAAGWMALVILDGFSTGPEKLRPLTERIEGLGALLILADEWPRARADILKEGLGETERALRTEGERWELRWLHFLFLDGLAGSGEAARDLEALPVEARTRLVSTRQTIDGSTQTSPAPGEVPLSAPRGLAVLAERLVEESRLASLSNPASGESKSARARREGLLAVMARAAQDEKFRPEAAEALVRASDSYARLLGAAWGLRSGLPGARDVLAELPLDRLAVARVAVELGEDELFLKRTRRERLDLAPLRVQVLERRGERDEARRLAEETLASAPDSFELRLVAASLARTSRLPERAAEHLQAAALLRPASSEPMREWMRLAADFPRRGDLTMPCAERYLARAAAETRAILTRGESIGAGGAMGGASGAMNSQPGSERLLVDAGFGLPSQGKTRAGALAALRDAVEAQPASGALGFLLGRVLFEEERWEEAAQAFSASIETVDPLDAPAIRPWLAASLRRAGRPVEAMAEEAAPDFRRADPAAAELDRTLASLGDASGAAARRFLERALASRPDFEDAALRLAHLAGGAPGDAMGRPEAVLEALEDRVDLARGGSAILELYARGLEGAGDWHRAAAVLGELADRRPESSGLRARVAWVQALAGDGARARRMLLGTGGGTLPTSVEGLIVLALLDAEVDGLEAAEALLGEAVRREPTDPRPWFLRGYFRSIGGREWDAHRDWGETIGLVDSGNRIPPGDGVPDPEALPWMVALAAARLGDAAQARTWAIHGSRAASTPLVVFFRAAALAALDDWVGAEDEAADYRRRGFPIAIWQTRDPDIGILFESPAQTRR